MLPTSKKFTVSHAIHEIETRYQSPKKYTNHKQDINTSTSDYSRQWRYESTTREMAAPKITPVK